MHPRAPAVVGVEQFLPVFATAWPVGLVRVPADPPRPPLLVDGRAPLGVGEFRTPTVDRTAPVRVAPRGEGPRPLLLAVVGAYLAPVCGRAAAVGCGGGSLRGGGRLPALQAAVDGDVFLEF